MGIINFKWCTKDAPAKFQRMQVMNDIGNALKSSHEVKNSSTDQLINNFVMSRAIGHIINKEYAKLRKRAKKMNLSMQTDPVGSYSQKKSFQKEVAMAYWQKLFFMDNFKIEVTHDSSLLLKGLPSYQVKSPSPYTILSHFDIKTLLEEDQDALKKMSADELVAHIGNKEKHFDDPFVEGQFFENKSKIDDPRGVAKGVLEALIAMHNAKLLLGVDGKPKVVCGIHDENHTPIGLEFEMARLHPNWSIDKWENILLRNVARSFTQSPIFERNLVLEFFNYKEHLILVLSLRDFDQLVLTDPKHWTLPVRVGASVRRLQGYELLKELTAYKSINNLNLKS